MNMRLCELNFGNVGVQSGFLNYGWCWLRQYCVFEKGRGGYNRSECRLRTSFSHKDWLSAANPSCHFPAEPSFSGWNPEKSIIICQNPDLIRLTPSLQAKSVTFRWNPPISVQIIPIPIHQNPAKSCKTGCMHLGCTIPRPTVYLEGLDTEGPMTCTVTTDAVHFFSFSSMSLTPLQLEKAKSTIMDLSHRPMTRMWSAHGGFWSGNKGFWQGPTSPAWASTEGKTRWAKWKWQMLLSPGPSIGKWTRLKSLWHMLMSGGFKVLRLGWECHRLLCSLLKAWCLWWKGLSTPKMGPCCVCRHQNKIWHSSPCYQMLQACDSTPLEALRLADTRLKSRWISSVSVFEQQTLTNIRRGSAPIRFTWPVALHTCWRRTRRSHDVSAICLMHIKNDSKNVVAIIFLKVSLS